MLRLLEIPTQTCLRVECSFRSSGAQLHHGRGWAGPVWGFYLDCISALASAGQRLNKNSMDKLYDLMTMGFKYQMLRCTCPAQLLHVTLNHLEALKRIVTDGAVGDLIDA